jgi:predicted kinase
LKHFGINDCPAIIIILGLPGSGKSYFAERLAKRLDADYINSDRLRKELFPERTYSESEKAKVYDAMFKKMEEASIKKKNLVLDATFHKRDSREQFIKHTKGKIYFIEVWAEENIIKERLQKSRRYSEADFKIHELIRQQWEPLEEDHLKLESTNDNIEIMLDKALAHLKHDASRDT